MRWLFRSGLPIEAFLHGAHSTHNFPQGRTANFIKFIVSSSLALFPPFLFLAIDLFMRVLKKTVEIGFEQFGKEQGNKGCYLKCSECFTKL